MRHYRSDSLAHMTAALHGYDEFVESYFRQALSRKTDPHSAGRQMVMHLCEMPASVLEPVAVDQGEERVVAATVVDHRPHVRELLQRELKELVGGSSDVDQDVSLMEAGRRFAAEP